MIRSGSPDQPPGDRPGRKGRRSWADPSRQPPWRPQPEPPPPADREPRRPPPHAPQRWTEPPHRHPPTREMGYQDRLETYGDQGYDERPPPPRRDARRYPERFGHPSERPTDEHRRPERRDARYEDRYDDRYDPADRHPADRHPVARYEDRGHPDDRYAEERYDDRHPDEAAPPEMPYPKKLTVTRVAALRSKQLTNQAVTAFRRAAAADGAEKSGLTALTYATMLNYASDAAMAVALANTLFFSAASGESKGKVALYLLITVAPFALLAPVIGPALDRIQRGRRFAMCAVSAGQAIMCLVMAMHFDDWLLYPAALGKMVLSKSFTVLKAAVTPRVLPPEITLAKTNARLTVFGLVAGGACGAVAALFANLFGSPGALWFCVVICLVGAVQALRIPSWVEVTEGEVPASISAHPQKPRRQPMGRHVIVSLWGNGTIRVLTGFLMLFAAFAVRAQNENEPVTQLLLLGVIAGAAGLGSFAGNAIGARIHVGHPEQVVIGCVIGALLATVVATLAAGIFTAALVGLVGAVASALAKNSLDAVIQDDLPEESRASAFGRSETVLQLGWVLGGAIGVLLPPHWWLGFLVVSVLLGAGLAQTLVSRTGGSLIPGFGGERPVRPDMRAAQQRFGQVAHNHEEAPPRAWNRRSP